MPEFNCAFCGKQFNRALRHINKRSKNLFCSRACKDDSQRTGGYVLDGYRIIRVDGKRIREHRYIVEQYLKRKLLPTEYIHHRDHNPLNNDISNLVIMSSTEHTQLHKPLSWNLDAAKRMRAEGASFDKIAKAFGVTTHAIHIVFIHRGLHHPDPRYRPQRRLDLEVAKTMRSEGHSFKAIGKAFGLSKTAIRLAFIRRGIPTVR